MRPQKYQEGFWNGWRQLRSMDDEKCRKEMMAAIKVNHEVTFRCYRLGRIEPKASQAAEIERVFARYGVTKNIWGDDKKGETPKNSKR